MISSICCCYSNISENLQKVFTKNTLNEEEFGLLKRVTHNFNPYKYCLDAEVGIFRIWFLLVWLKQATNFCAHKWIINKTVEISNQDALERFFWTTCQEILRQPT